MSTKLWMWFKAVRDESTHAQAATRADLARTHLVGKGTVVEKHLHRIYDRERALQEFARIIADSPALNEDEE